MGELFPAKSQGEEFLLLMGFARKLWRDSLKAGSLRRLDHTSTENRLSTSCRGKNKERERETQSETQATIWTKSFHCPIEWKGRVDLIQCPLSQVTGQSPSNFWKHLVNHYKRPETSGTSSVPTDAFHMTVKPFQSISYESPHQGNLGKAPRGHRFSREANECGATLPP